MRIIMKPIGGYFELELNPGQEYHRAGIRLNLGRTAFEYILRARKAQKVFLPFYNCKVMLEPIKKLGLEFEFYEIDENLESLIDCRKLKKDEYFLYTNYFGLKDRYIKKLTKIGLNVIIDNAQAFYSRPVKGIDTFYSPRKFFGVPDGAYLYTDARLAGRLEQDSSTGRFGHLIGRMECGAEAAYRFFKDNEQLLTAQPLMLMSNITQRLLQNIDYKKVAQTRRENYLCLHQHLHKTNRLKLNLNNEAVPMVYPYLTDKPGLREKLIINKVFVAQYWSNVLQWSNKESIEAHFAERLVFLPIDQRYSSADMLAILDILDKLS
jgi:hypothetical protein